MLVDASYAYPIPAGLTDAEAAPLLCPGVTAYGAVRKAQLAPGQHVGVLGVGGVGHLAVQMAALTGADVHAITRSAEHRLLAEELGARYSQPSGDAGLKDASLDATVVFAPSDEVVREAMRVTKPGGRIVLGVAQNVGHLDIGDEKTVVGSVLGNRADVLAVLRLAADRRVRSVVSEHPLSEANQVLASLKAGEVRARAVLVP
jgi:propanol-preferring alcohol dehydrogenase